MGPDPELSSIGQNPCGPLAGNQDRDRRPCEGLPNANAARPMASAPTASRIIGARTRVRRFPAKPAAVWVVLEAAKAKTRKRLRAQLFAQSVNAGLRSRQTAVLSFLAVLANARLSPTRSAGPGAAKTMIADRSTLFFYFVLFLLVLIGIPSAAHSSTLEDAAKELARKIVAVLPAGENLKCEIRNLSSLKAPETARIEQAVQVELQERGIGLTGSGTGTTLVVTLSENFENFVWTGEIHEGDTSQMVLITVKRSSENRLFSGARLVTIHSEKFWEGPERILDAGEVSGNDGKSWMVLLLPDGLLIQDKHTGPVISLEVPSNQSATRDPWGNLSFELIGNTVEFFLAPKICTVNLEAPDLSRCLLGEGSNQVPATSPVIFDIAPADPPQPGKGTEIEMKPVCSDASQFLATGARDYTQMDTLQLFQVQSSGAAPVSNELDFPGPITALHAGSITPRAVVRNLTTGNYEAYTLSFSCAH